MPRVYPTQILLINLQCLAVCFIKNFFFSPRVGHRPIITDFPQEWRMLLSNWFNVFLG